MPFSKKMQVTTFRWSLNLFLAIIIFANAEIGRLLGVETLPIALSAVWPATGFALAALLLFGYRTWPGIFLGNFAYYFLHLYLNSTTLWSPFLIAILITAGPFIQSLLACYYMRKYCSKEYFQTFKDVSIFLLTGAFTCVIAATFAIFALYLFDSLPMADVPYAWLNFWIGDTVGVYIFTPLLVVFSLTKPKIELEQAKKERTYMVIAFVLLNVLTFIKSYALSFLFFPLSVWVAYRYGMRGASAFNFITALVSVITTSLGYGTFLVNYTANPLLMLVSFLDMLVATSLLAASIPNERVVQTQGEEKVDLERVVETKISEPKEEQS